MFAYDLVHDTYSPAEHAKLRVFLREKLQFMFNIAEINSGSGHPHSNWSAQYRAAVGMVALALLADPAAELPATMDWEPAKVAPVAEDAGVDGRDEVQRAGRGGRNARPDERGVHAGELARQRRARRLVLTEGGRGFAAARLHDAEPMAGWR
jgi:hypothetical protein